MDAIIVKFVGSLLSAFKLAAGWLVSRAMAALGLSWVSFEYVLPEVKSWLVDRADLLPARAVQFLSAVGLDVFMVLIISAIVAKIGIQVFMVGADKLQSMIDQAGG